MEVRKYKDIMGGVATENIKEGRMVLIAASHSEGYDFGSRNDLPGMKLPDTSGEAAKAIFMAAFALDNSSLPIYQPYPAYTFALRNTYDQTANVPFTADVYLTHPSDMLSQTIPSGAPMLGYAGGVFTVHSGDFIAASVVEGGWLDVADTDSDSADDAGKFKYSASATNFLVQDYDTTNQKLIVRIEL